MSNAAYSLSDMVDQFVAAMYTQASTGNVLDGSGYTMSTVGEPYDLLVDLGVKLTEANVPKQGRYAVVPPWFTGNLLKDPNFINAEKSGSTAPLLNGQVGQAAGFAILESNNVVQPSAGTTYVIQVGTPMAISFANQIVETEAMRDPASFSDLMRGLHVYGGKVMQPDGLGYSIVTRA
jgi:N4-gp56 family major capsid protein